MRHLCIITITICMFLVPNFAFSENNKLPIAKILEIANKKAIEVGYDINKADTVVFENCIPREVLFPDAALAQPQLEVRNKLGNKTYWAVFYVYLPKPGTFGVGGDLTIYVDAVTGEILEVFMTA